MGTLPQRAVAEALGTAMLLAAVVGTGIVGERLAAGNVALVLLANTLATGAALVALILTFGPISGAHLNPVVVIWGCVKFRPAVVPFAVAGYISAAYWFTASTSFANPAVTLARSASNTFTGIRPDVPGFVGGQLLGAAAATLLFRWLTNATNSGEKE